MSKKNTSNPVVEVISHLVISYLKKYEENILGVYFVPYQLENSKKIEVVFVKKNSLEFPISMREVIVNNYRIYPIVNSIVDYHNFRFKKDLQSGIILYDPSRILEKKKNKNLELSPFFNTFSFSNEYVKMIKGRLYTHARRK